MLKDTKIKRLENEVTQVCLVNKPRMTRQDTNGHTTTLEYCNRELMTLLPWLRLHLTKRSNKGSAQHKIKHAALDVMKEIELCPWTILEGELKSGRDGMTT